MTDYGDEQEHADVMLALLRARPITVYPATTGGPATVPPGAGPPYVSVRIFSQHVDGDRLQHWSTRTITHAYAYCVGANGIAARAMAAQVAEAWLDVRPEIDGRSVYPIRHEQTREVDVTEPVAQTTVTILAIYRLEDQPGRASS